VHVGSIGILIIEVSFVDGSVPVTIRLIFWSLKVIAVDWTPG
jgi:hypothetical protein